MGEEIVGLDRGKREIRGYRKREFEGGEREEQVDINREWDLNKREKQKLP